MEIQLHFLARPPLGLYNWLYYFQECMASKNLLCYLPSSIRLRAKKNSSCMCPQKSPLMTFFLNLWLIISISHCWFIFGTRPINGFSSKSILTYSMRINPTGFYPTYYTYFKLMKFDFDPKIALNMVYLLKESYLLSFCIFFAPII